MPSPFPGMNPYIERASVREILTAQVLPRYFVRIDEQMFIHELSAEERRFIGRGDVLFPALTPAGSSAATAGSILEAPHEVGIR